jgi:hypothetical protein
MDDDDLACPSCGRRIDAGLDVGLLGDPTSSFIVQCSSCGWTGEGEGTDWGAVLVPYEDDSDEEAGPREGWPLTSEGDGTGEPPGW